MESLERSHKLTIAPMMDWTDRHCRCFLRLFSRHALLYSEMITTAALLHGDWRELLRYSPEERPLALQLGGDDPEELAWCAHLAQEEGYSEINLNVGCPSDRVQSGNFGACLMKTPERVAEAVAAMQARVRIPITVKHRIGVDEVDSFGALCRFVSAVADGGCRTFIVHARKAWLKGLSPKHNRNVPPLQYETVYRLKEAFPALSIEINGGIRTLDEARRHLERVDGVMIGRAAYRNPYLLADADSLIFGDSGAKPPTREALIDALLPYVEQMAKEQIPVQRIARHILGLFHGERGARVWRRYLSENAWRPGAGANVIREALDETKATCRQHLERVDVTACLAREPRS